jgi:protein involved in polysaccharide export with SLBB domain
MLALPMLLHAPGCATDRASVEKNLLTQRSSEPNSAVLEHYRISCPDMIELVVGQRPEFSGRYQVGVDGRIDLGDYGKLPVEDKTPGEIARAINAETGASLESVQVRVVEFRSQHLLLFGEVAGSQRSVSYQGQETVLDLLQRVGGVTRGAEPRDVYVVRPHLGDSKRPEVFHVDLHGIVIKNDPKTNLRLLPFDQIYVGETRRAQIQKAIAPLLRWASPTTRDVGPTAAK